MAQGRGSFFPVQTHDLGPTGSFASFNEATLPHAGKLGSVVEDNGKVYRLVQHSDGTGAVATASGWVAHWEDKANFLVTSDQTDAETAIAGVAGAYLGVVTDQNYCWIQIGGDGPCGTSAAGAIGDPLSGGTTDGVLTINTELLFGPIVAVKLDASATGNVRWNLGALL